MQYNLISYQDKVDLEIDSKKSIFSPYQLSVKFSVFPMSDKYRFLVNHSTGSGKTVTSLLVAKNFLDYNLNVFVVTFNQTQFLNELQSIPEFGFITMNEYQQIQEKTEQSDRIQRVVNRRIRNKITFIGYRELFINIFGTGQTINRQMVNRFKNSLIICDEIHNIYNHNDKNIYGVSIQFLSYVLGKQLHMVFLSATPLSYSGELGSLLSIMQVNTLQNEKINQLITEIEQQHLFKSQSLISDTSNNELELENKAQLVQDLIEKLTQSFKITPENVNSLIKDIMKDKVSFIPEIQKDFPLATQKGIQYKAIPNIIIQKCNIGKYFKDIMISTNYFSGDESSKSIIIHPVDNFYQVVLKLIREDADMVKWAKENNIQLVQSLFNPTITGSFLKAENIGKYCPKLGFLFEQLLTVNTKSFIYINKLKGFGVDILVESLKVNGILIGDQNPNNQTICFICKQQQSKHGNEHIFNPYRAVVLTGSNIVEGEKHLKLFNSSININTPKYHIMIGNIKMKEAYNVLAVNNMFILTLPYNITNYIQVLGRCIRTKSHAELPQSLQYVNTYLLVNSCENSEQLDNSAFQNLKQLQDKSKFYGMITREEIDIWDKNLDFQIVQQYEAKIHQQSIDTKYFHKMYFNSVKQDDQLNIITQNPLKMNSFTIQDEKQVTEFDITQDLSEFYLLNISQVINNTIQTRISQLFKQTNIWQVNDLIQAVFNYPSPPNIKIVPIDVVKQRIFTAPNVHILNNFAIYSVQVPELNFFLPLTSKTPATIIQSTKKQATNINQQDLVELYEYIKKLCPSYIQTITNRQVPKILSSVPDFTMEHVKHIDNSLKKIFGKVSIPVIQQNYKQYILQYNDSYYKQQQEQETSCIIFLSIVNLIFPFTYQSQTQLQKTKIYAMSNSIIDSLVLNGYLLDINSQIYINANGEQSSLVPNREKFYSKNIIFYNLTKNEIKISEMVIQKDNVAKTIGNSCLNMTKQELQKFKQVDNLTKQQHCDSILSDRLFIYLENIFTFKQLYNIVFNTYF